MLRPKLSHSKAGRPPPPRPGADRGSILFDFMTRGARAQVAVDRILEEHRVHDPDEGERKS
jgi:hypothetical protein